MIATHRSALEYLTSDTTKLPSHTSGYMVTIVSIIHTHHRPGDGNYNIYPTYTTDRAIVTTIVYICPTSIYHIPAGIRYNHSSRHPIYLPHRPGDGNHSIHLQYTHHRPGDGSRGIDPIYLLSAVVMEVIVLTSRKHLESGSHRNILSK